ncbi:MAG: phosphoribosylanthranilate isomerase [Puniceicoccales bacterium]|nr:phosphoribosylanthranilate isomerase [Puniceicoccales bacterium]
MSFTVKVCGVTRHEDAAAALALGADFIGVNAWERSPRFVAGGALPALLAAIPAGRRVCVDVQPDDNKLLAAQAAGADFFQIHFDPFAERARECAEAWAARVGRGRLWLAPRVAPEDAWPRWVAELADTLLFDGHRAGQFGGTGRTADGARFRQLFAEYPQTRWILAGGLGEGTVAAAWENGARFFDLNSGVEDSPGVKSAAKLARVLAVLRGCAAA